MTFTERSEVTGSLTCPHSHRGTGSYSEEDTRTCRSVSEDRRIGRECLRRCSVEREARVTSAAIGISRGPECIADGSDSRLGLSAGGVYVGYGVCVVVCIGVMCGVYLRVCGGGCEDAGVWVYV